MEKSSHSPLFGLLDFFFISALFNKIHIFIRNIVFFFLSQSNSANPKLKDVVQSSVYEVSHGESLFHENTVRESDGKVEREEVKMVMEKMGFVCSPESDELEDRYSSDEISGMFEEEEPSLEEVKQAFDVFDENKDGFIDGRELKRVLCILGLKEVTELENCQKMIANFDQNGDGRIDFHEFVKIMERTFF